MIPFLTEVAELLTAAVVLFGLAEIKKTGEIKKWFSTSVVIIDENHRLNSFSGRRVTFGDRK